ncbi:hypothetical protein [Granulicella sibirica]|uniref:Uncharacterized protein n=1 Tax=Granulicella sibirica TaxID=2479048 RepID=A0A4Q0T544_9BACT|nr:hypothetical protein [Granulicella sibirica]RXH57129.1 hypothetical protein GRAN_0439 [Granulicella sibirica]
MSLSVISSYAIFEPTLLTGPVSPSAPTSSTEATGENDDIATADSTNDSVTLTAVIKDLVSLLKGLVSGDVSASKSDLSRIRAEAKSRESSASDPPTPSPLQRLLGKIADSISSGDTPTALGVVAGFLVHAGQPSGNLIDTHA